MERLFARTFRSVSFERIDSELIHLRRKEIPFLIPRAFEIAKRKKKKKERRETDISSNLTYNTE